MNLTQEQKTDLENLKKHPGFKVLQLIEEEATNNLGKFLLNTNLNDEKNLKVIQENQIYIKARQDFFSNVDKHLQEIYSPDY